MKDTEGVNIGPLVEAAAKEWGLPVVLFLGMLWAESGLNRTAARRGVWPDVSFGYPQITVRAAGGLGVGDSSNTDENIDLVERTLFVRETGINLGARCLKGHYNRAQASDLPDIFLQSLISYNSGSPQPEGNWYWQRFASHIASYRAALSWASRQVLGEE